MLEIESPSLIDTETLSKREKQSIYLQEKETVSLSFGDRDSLVETETFSKTEILSLSLFFRDRVALSSTQRLPLFWRERLFLSLSFRDRELLF